MTLRGRVYYFGAENRSDAQVMVFALAEIYVGAVIKID